MLDEIAGGRFVDGRDTVVVEGWLASKAALCAHIEIVAGHAPIVSAAWQQIIDDDGTSYLGAGPLTLSTRALASFVARVNCLAAALRQVGAVGSYAPDFLVVADHETRAEPDTSVLIELNARIPAPPSRWRSSSGSGAKSGRASAPGMCGSRGRPPSPKSPMPCRRPGS